MHSKHLVPERPESCHAAIGVGGAAAAAIDLELFADQGNSYCLIENVGAFPVFGCCYYCSPNHMPLFGRLPCCSRSPGNARRTEGLLLLPRLSRARTAENTLPSTPRLQAIESKCSDKVTGAAIGKYWSDTVFDATLVQRRILTICLVQIICVSVRLHLI